MNKVMTRAQRRPGTRPPGRLDTRRPGGSPPRTPPGGLSRSAPDDPSRLPARTASTRPPTAPRLNGARTPLRTGSRLRSGATGTPAATAGRADNHAPHRTGGTAPRAGTARTESRTAAGTRTAVTRGTAPAVDAQAALRAASLPVATDLFADRLLAVLSGQRPVHWMLRHTAGRAYDELARLAEHGALRTRGARPVVRDIGYYEPRPGAVEAFARIGAGDRLRAMAFRLEQGRDRRWRCTAVELGGPRTPRADDELP